MNHAEQERVHIIIVGERFGFPYGGGASARVLAYSKAVLYTESRVSVYCMNYTEIDSNTAVNTKRSGVYKQIPFYYLCVSPIRSSTFIKRRLSSILGRIRTIHLIISLKPTAIIGYTKSLSNILIIALASRLAGSRLVLEMCEITYKYPIKNSIDRFRRKCRYTIVSHLSNGFIAISDFMVKHIKESYTKKKAIIKIPILVDVSDFQVRDIAHEKSITYLGNLDRIDEIEAVINSFAIVSREYNIHLRIAGSTNDKKKMADLLELVNNTGISNRIHLMGMIKREDLPSLLGSSLMLILPRKRGLFSDAGFPTKLGEYLASGRPVVVTNVGEIGNYLTDRENALLVEPEDLDSFAVAIRYLLENPQKADEIGAAGKKLAEKEFDYRQYGVSLVNFLVPS